MLKKMREAAQAMLDIQNRTVKIAVPDLPPHYYGALARYHHACSPEKVLQVLDQLQQGRHLLEQILERFEAAEYDACELEQAATEYLKETE